MSAVQEKVDAYFEARFQREEKRPATGCEH